MAAQIAANIANIPTNINESFKKIANNAARTLVGNNAGQVSSLSLIHI